MPEIPWIDRHRFCPPHMQEQHAQRADRVQVLSGIQRQPSHPFRGRIAALQRDPTVGTFVDNQAEQDAEHIEQDIHDLFPDGHVRVIEQSDKG